MARKKPEYFDLIWMRFFAPSDEYVFDIKLYPVIGKRMTNDDLTEPCYLELMGDDSWGHKNKKMPTNTLFEQLQGKVEDETFGINFKRGFERLRFETYFDVMAFANAFNNALDWIYGKCTEKEGMTTIPECKYKRGHRILYEGYWRRTDPTAEDIALSEGMNSFDLRNDNVFNPITREHEFFNMFSAESDHNLFGLHNDHLYKILKFDTREIIVEYLRDHGLDMDFEFPDAKEWCPQLIYFKKEDANKFIKALDLRMSEMYLGIPDDTVVRHEECIDVNVADGLDITNDINLKFK